MIYIRRFLIVVVGSIIVFTSLSCGTTGGKQVETVIYDMHRRVTKIDKNFDSVNTTFANLSVRLDNAEQSMRELKSVIEENQVKLNQLSKELTDLKTTLYKHLNLTVSSLPSSPSTPTPKEASVNVEILPPSAAQPPAITVPPTTTSTTTTPQPQPTSAPQTTSQTPLAAEPLQIQPTASGNPRDEYLDAQRVFSSGQYEEALKKFDEFAKKYPTHENTPNAIFWKAKCLLNLNKFEEAIREFENLKNTYPTHNKVPTALQNEAVAYSRLGQYDKAKQLLKEVIEKYPTTPAAEQAKSDLEKIEKIAQ